MSTGLAVFTLVHVVICLAGIVSGFVMLGGVLAGRLLKGWNLFFFVTTVLTNATGFGFPFDHLLPAHYVGILSLVVLALGGYALMAQKLKGCWRTTYMVAAVVALYFNVFVLVVQMFAKVPALHSLAPTQAEPAFAIVQGLVAVAFIGLGVRAVRRFRLVE